MEHSADESRSSVYFCSSTQDDIHELYHKKSPPESTVDAHPKPGVLDRIYHNVRSLLDEDQGGFDEVFVCSNSQQCLDRLESYGNAAPTVVLVELRNAHQDGQLLQDRQGASAFLRHLSSDIEGAHYQKHVLPFALLTSDNPSSFDGTIDGEVTTCCLQAGAVDIIHSPLHHDDINRIIGHVKEIIRPPARLIASQMTQNLVDSIHDFSEPRAACHRPDIVLSKERKRAVEQAVREWHFPAQDFNMDELTYAVLFMLEHILQVPELEPYSLDRTKLMTLLLATRRQYKHEREVHYHNWRHAVDVTQSIYCFLVGARVCPPLPSNDGEDTERGPIERLLTPLDGLILLVSAIGHDVGHPGVNNAFLVACNHPLAQNYNDKSVLENYHCAAYSQLLRRHWPALNNIPGFRATMISTILATDMQRHFEFMKSMSELKAKTESSEASVDQWGDKDREYTRELVMALLIKAADISNVARPFDISSRWARILMNEFARQGELESELQIPTCLFGGPPDKDDILAAAQSQKGFMSLFGFPLFQGISQIMPSVSCSVKELENNQKVWDDKIAEEKERRTLGPKEGHLTFSSVTRAEVEQATAHHQSEPVAVPAEWAQPPSTPTKRRAATGREVSPSRHAAHDLRQQLAQGIALDDEKRSSAPFLGSPPYSPHNGSSRRSSKDVALDQLQQLNNLAHQNLSPTSDSRRGSADAGWQIHQSYPNSRRGSKDDSLTTILVTSGGTPNRRNSPSSPAKTSSPGKHPGKRNSIQQSQKATTARTSVPSSRSHATSTATANTYQQSPSTQPSTQSSSLSQEEDEGQPTENFQSIPSTEDPFIAPGSWPNDTDGAHRMSPPAGMSHDLPGTPPTPPPNLSLPKSEVSRVTSAPTSGETDDSRSTPRKSDRGVRESRSRSRLRGLKFWKKKKDVPTVDGTTDSPGGSP